MADRRVRGYTRSGVIRGVLLGVGVIRVVLRSGDGGLSTRMITLRPPPRLSLRPPPRLSLRHRPANG